MRVWREPNRRCMRGLHWHYFTEPAVDSYAVANALEEAFEGQMIRGDEQWGSLTVIRLILQFVVEFRIGEREGQVSLIHRVTADEQTRERSQQYLQLVLERLVEGSDQR